MPWHTLLNNGLTVATEPTPEQIAKAKAEWHKSPVHAAPQKSPFVTAKVLLSKLSEVEQEAITTEAVKQLAAGSPQLSNWWSNISKGVGLVNLQSPKVKAIQSLLVANGVLTQYVVTLAFSS